MNNAKRLLPLLCLAASLSAAAPVGVAVNGVDVSALSGAGWTWDPATSNLVLSAAGPYVLSGSNMLGQVAAVVRPPAGETAEITISNLALASSAAAPFALETNASVRLLLDGTNSLSSARSGQPALLVPADASLVVSNATDGLPFLAAAGGAGAAAIGGASDGSVGSIGIAGGRIVAHAAGYGASGIGAGFRGTGGSVAISGGLVDAVGGNPGTGLGGGSGGKGPSVAISGGTVFAQGNGTSVDVGPTFPPVAANAPQTVLVAGGSLRPFDMLHDSIRPAPSNGTERVWCVTVTNLPPDTLVEDLEGLPAGYGTRDLFADAGGKVYLWLPDGEYEFTVGETGYRASVDGAHTVASTVEPPVPDTVGVFVDGVDVSAFSGDGWTYDPATSNLVLSAAGPYVLSGTNTAGEVQVVGCPASGGPQSIVLSNLVLSAAAPLALETNALALLTVAGESSLSATAAGRPAILVPAGASLLVAGGEAVRDSLSATGGDAAPAVSGAGTLGLAGGRLSFAGGAGAASLGPGSLVVFGGTTVAPSVSAATSALLAGGSFRAAFADVSPAPSNATERVFCVTVTNLVPNAAVENLAGLPGGYGVGGIVADDDGRVYLWLPDGDYAFTAGGADYTATVDGANTVAALAPPVIEPLGVLVNGVDVCALAGEGWTYDPATSNLVLSAAGPFAISGTNVAGEVTVLCRALADGEVQSVSISNFVLSSSAASPFALEAGAAVVLSLAGTNELASSKSGQPALLVPGGASLTVTNAPSEPTNGGTLSAVATAGAPGIGGLAYAAVGDIAIAGGRVVARGASYGAAGIGAGNGGTGGSISISGGLVDATGGSPGAALGGGSGGSGNGPSVSVSGGTVVARGPGNAEDVGPSTGQLTAGARQTVLLTGGSLHALAGRIAPAPSNGTERVWCVIVTNLPPAALVEGLQGLPAGYGARDLYADADGKLYLWLPGGDYELRIAPDDLWTATVADKDVVAAYRSVAKPDSIVIDSITVAEDAVTLVVTVAPAAWLEAHAGDLRVRASDTLPVSAGEILDPSTVSIAADPATGEATLVLPSPALPARFYRVEVP